MCDLCGNIAHNQEGQDPTRTLTLRDNYGNAWKKRLALAAGLLVASPLMGSFAGSTITDNTFQIYITEQLGLQLATDWQDPFVRSTVSSSFVQGSLRLREPIDLEAATDLPLFQRTYEAALPGHIQSRDKSIERTAGLLLAAAVKARSDNFAATLGDTQAAIEAEILRVSSAGLPASEAVSAADTLVVGTHAESIIDYYQAAGVTVLMAEVEFVTAGDDRVCPDCESLAGQTFLLADSRGIIPVHIGCRCSWWPKVLR